MSLALPQVAGIGSVAGTIVGTMLMMYGGFGEMAVYLCAAACGSLSPLAAHQLRRTARRTAAVKPDRYFWSHARSVALGR